MATPKVGVRGQRHHYGVRPARSGRGGPGGSAPSGVRGSAPTKTVRPSEDKMRSNDLKVKGPTTYRFTRPRWNATYEIGKWNDLKMNGSNDLT